MLPAVPEVPPAAPPEPRSVSLSVVVFSGTPSFA
jgi:hypothetical protein